MASNKSFTELTVQEVEDYLEGKGVGDDVIANFRRNRVTGAAFLRLTEEDLRELVPLIGERTDVREILKRIKQDTDGDDKETSTSVGSSSTQAQITTMPNLDGVLSDWHLSFEVPEKETFSWAVQKAIETGVVCAKPRRDIIQVLRTLMLQHTKYPSSEEYTSISRKLVLKYPTLHDGGTTGFGSWKLSLRTAFKNFRRDHPTDNTGHRQKSTASAEPPSKRQRISDGGAQEITDEEYDDAIDKLKAECKKNKGKNHATIKELMQVTEQRRRKWIEEESPLVVEILSKYPSLTSTKVLRREFRLIADISCRAASLMSSWPDWTKQIVQFSKAESATRPVLHKLLLEYEEVVEVDIPADRSDSIVLNLLLKLLYPRGPPKDCVFLKVFEVCDIDVDEEASKIKQSAPYIIQTGVAGDGNTQYFIACEQSILCESKTLQDSIVDLIASFFVFNISYPKGVCGVLLFFQHYVFDLKDSQHLPPCTQKLVNNLSKLPPEQ